MLNLEKGTKCINILLFSASKDVCEPFVQMFFPILAHTSAIMNFNFKASLEGFF